MNHHNSKGVYIYIYYDAQSFELRRLNGYEIFDIFCVPPKGADYKTKFQMETASLYANCPKTCGSCAKHGLSAKITLHGNWLACKIPFAINRSRVQAIALMGNLLGDGTELNASWISEDGKSQKFLYFSEEVWESELRPKFWIHWQVFR